MPRRNAEIIILSEDSCQANLVRGYLKSKNYEPAKFRVVPHPQGAGSGKKHVLDKYPVEVHVHRSKATHVNRALVVAIDADTQTVDQVHSALDNALTATRLTPRQQDERIAILVPKRNVETWVVHLRSSTVDENTDYSRQAEACQCQPAGRELAEQDLRDAPPSLTRGKAELQQRLP